MSEYFNDTVDSINSSLIGRRDMNVFRKLEGSSSKGFMYAFKGLNGEPIWGDVRIDENLEYVVFRAYRETLIADKAYIPAIAEFCARHPLKVGNIGVDCQHKCVYYHCEAAFIDFAVTEKTIRAFEKCAAAAFAAYGKVFDKLSVGKLYDETDVGDPAPALEPNSLDPAPSVEAIRRYLIKGSGYNTRCQTCGEGDDLFFGEILSDENRYSLRISYASEDRSFLVMRLYPGFKTVVDEAYIHMCAEYANRESDKVKTSYLCVNGGGDDGFCGVLHISLLEGVVTGKTVEDAERILIGFVRRHLDALVCLANGCLLPERDDKDGKPKSKKSGGFSGVLDDLLADLRRGRHGSDDDDDDYDEDDDLDDEIDDDDEDDDDDDITDLFGSLLDDASSDD